LSVRTTINAAAARRDRRGALKAMTDAATTQRSPVFADPIGRLLERCADAAAIIGGLLLCAMILTTVASVAGRALAGLGRKLPIFAVFGPVPGDYEILSMAGAVAVASFMPLCQMRSGHVVADLLFRSAGPRWQALFALIGNLLFALVGALILRSVLAGAIDKHGYRETTMLLRLPAWWGYAGVAFFFAIAILAAVHLTLRDLRRLLRGEAQP
jgi:TRAP-type C4-dicarboxylate transport system permease small subunit